jgi:DivIVA domain-containing protein
MTASGQPPIGEVAGRSRPGVLAPGSPVRTGLLVLLAYAVVGVVAGVVWEWIWTPPGEVIAQHQIFYDGYPSLRRVFTGTGIYVLVGAGASAVVALSVCALTRGRELLVLVLVLVGSAIGAALMWRVGTHLGPSDPTGLAAHTVARTPVSGNLTVAGKSPYLVWPMTTLLVLAIIYFAWPSAALSPSRGDSRAAHRGSGGELPPDQQRLVDSVRSVRFKPVRIRRGYQMSAVDAVLDYVVEAVGRGEPLAPLLDTSLPTVTWREGYDMADVDSFLTSLRKSTDARDTRG